MFNLRNKNVSVWINKMPKSKEFLELISSVKKQYTGEPVPLKYRGRYGSRYSEKEAERIAYAVAKKMGMRT